MGLCLSSQDLTTSFEKLIEASLKISFIFTRIWRLEVLQIAGWSLRKEVYWQIMVSSCWYSSLVIFLCLVTHIQDWGKINWNKILLCLSGANIPTSPLSLSNWSSMGYSTICRPTLKSTLPRKRNSWIKFLCNTPNILIFINHLFYIVSSMQ